MLRPIRPFSASANLRGFPLCPLFFALRPCLSSQSLGSSSAVLLFSQPSRCSFLASHFPQRISLLLRLLLLRSAVCLSLSDRGACRSQRSAIRSAATSPQRFPSAVSLALLPRAFPLAVSLALLPRAFPLAVSLSLRPSASPWRFLFRSVPALPLWRFLPRFAPALPLGGFRASSQRFSLAVSLALRPIAFPLAVSLSLRPSACPWRFLSRSVPALFLGGFSLASPHRFPLAVSLSLRPSASHWRFLSHSDQRFSSREPLRAHAPAWKFFSKIPLGIFELRRFFPRLRRFVLCSCRRRGSPTIKPGGDERMCDGLPNAVETIERLARESERLSIELQAVKQENEALKAKISELEKKLETA